MEQMNWRKPIYFSYASVRGYRFPQYLAEYWQDWKSSDGRTASAAALGRLLRRLTYTLEQTPLRWFGLSHLLVIEKI